MRTESGSQKTWVARKVGLAQDGLAQKEGDGLANNFGLAHTMGWRKMGLHDKLGLHRKKALRKMGLHIKDLR